MENNEKNVLNNVSSYHAEMGVLYQTNRELLRDCILIVVRIDQYGNLINSKPCEKCQPVLERWGVTIYYSV